MKKDIIYDEILECITNIIKKSNNIIINKEENYEFIENIDLFKDEFMVFDYIIYNQDLNCFIPLIIHFGNFDTDVIDIMDKCLNYFEKINKNAIGMIIFIKDYVDIIEYTLNKKISSEYIEKYNEIILDKNNLRSEIYKIISK